MEGVLGQNCSRTHSTEGMGVPSGQRRRTCSTKSRTEIARDK